MADSKGKPWAVLFEKNGFLKQCGVAFVGDKAIKVILDSIPIDFDGKLTILPPREWPPS